MAPGILIDHHERQEYNISVKSQPSETQRWPKCLSGSPSWTPEQYQDSQTYTFVLADDEIAEAESALETFKDCELDGYEITEDNFHLPTLGPKLQGLSHELHLGKGFFSIRGLDPKKYSVEDNTLLFLGISSHIAGQRAKQDNAGNMLVHLRHDREVSPTDGEGPLRLSNKSSPFHTDMFVDILAFQVRERAAQGGEFKISSSWQIYNQLRTTRPDLVNTLASSSWHFESRGKLFPSSTRPLLFYHEGRVIFDFARRPLLGQYSQKVGLTNVQTEALEAVEKLARKNQLYLDMKLGDLVFVNNHAVLHSRESFLDDADHKRHVVRMWLRNRELAWALPKQLAEGSDRIFEDKSLPMEWDLTGKPKGWSGFRTCESSH